MEIKTVADLISELQKLPQDADVVKSHGGMIYGIETLKNDVFYGTPTVVII